MSKKIFNKLPDIFKTNTNEKFFEATFEQAFSKRDNESFSGFIGRKTGGLVEPFVDYYKNELTSLRNNYQLEPTVFTTNPDTGVDSNYVFYDDFLNYLRAHKGNIENHDKLFSGKYYSFSPPIDIDKFLNYQNYFWIWDGPEVVEISGVNDAAINSSILGQEEYIYTGGASDLEFTNGLLVTFPDSSSYTDEYYVEGVGTQIILVKFEDDLYFPTLPDPTSAHLPLEFNPDYLTIARGSCDGNLWSRTNRWVHKDIISIAYDDFPSDAIQASRPILEFIKDLELYNHGDIYLQDVTIFSDDDFSTVNGAPTPYVFDSGGTNEYTLQTGDTLIFDNDDWIWEADVSGPTVVLTQLVQSNVGEGVYIREANNRGKSYYNKLSMWTLADHEKVTKNQEPLFMLYDTDGNKLSDDLVYPDTTFNGSEIFSYKVNDNGQNDSILGFPLTYKDLGQVSDIVFENDLESHTFQYTIDSLFYDINGYYFYRNKNANYQCVYDEKYQTSWFYVDEELHQRVVDRYALIEEDVNPNLNLDESELKDSVRVLQSVELNVTPAGAGIGKTLTSNVNEELVIDGVTLDLGDRVLYAVSPITVDNGIYTLTQLGDAVTPYILTRSSDADFIGDLRGGNIVPVNEGSFNGGTVWEVSTEGEIDIDVEEIEFSKINVGRKIFELSAIPHEDQVTAKLEGNKLTKGVDFHVFNTALVNFVNGLDLSDVIEFEISYDLITNEPISQIDRNKNSFRLEVRPHYATISVYKNAVLQTEGVDYNISNNVVVELSPSLIIEENQVLEIFTLTKGDLKEGANGYFEIPNNLEKNPLTDTVYDFSTNDLLLHFNSIINNQESDKDYRDTARDYSKGTYVIQHLSALPKAMLVSSDNNIDIIQSIRHSSREYTRFKNKLIKKVERMINDGFQPFNPGDQIDVDVWLEEAIKEITTTREHPESFKYSYMIANGAVFEEELFSGDGAQTNYILSEYIDLEDLKNVLYVYVDNELQLVDYDYEIVNLNPVEIAFSVAPPTGTENIITRLYSNAEPAYIPATPSKLGMYPVYRPEIKTDTSYLSPVDVLIGHDGSKIPLYGDYRDDILFELEKRIYNGIPDKFRNDYNLLLPFEKVKPGKFRDNKFTLDEFNDVVKSLFYKWASYNRVNFKTNSTFDTLENKTWNYTGYGTEDSDLPGNWKGIYEYYYDTQTPHETPWEMLGFSKKPDWWDTEYGTGPWADSDPMWVDIQAGEIKQGNREGVDSLYVRPDMISMYHPVDALGDLRMPEDIGIATVPSESDKERDWVFGDFSPAEYAWRSSETFPFVVSEILYLLRPADFGERFYDPIKETSSVIDPDQIILIGTSKRDNNQQLYVHGELNENNEIVINTGYQNWITDRILFLNRNLTLDFGNAIRNLGIKLGHKVGGFVNPDTLTLTAESFLSQNASLIIPVEDINISIYTGKSTDEIKYSGVIVRYYEGKYQVFGYDIVDSGFNYFVRNRDGRKNQVKVGDTPVSFTIFEIGRSYTKNEIIKHNSAFYRAIEAHDADKFYRDLWKPLPSLPSTGGISVTHYFDSTGEIDFIEYGHFFDTIEDVYNFLIGYQEYLEFRGWSFDDVNTATNKLNNWTESAKQFLFWLSGGVANNSAMRISPSATKATLKFDDGYPANIEKSYNGVYSILNEFGVLIDPKDSRIDRDADELTVVPPDGSGIYFIQVPMEHTEHIITVNNETVFNDLIYDPFFGTRQSRLKLKTIRTLNWQGRREAPGYIISDSGKLLPNYENIVSSISNYHNTEVDIDRPNIEVTARHLIGFESKRYLVNLGLSGDTQFQFYQGMILQKGTIESINKLLRSSYASNDQQITTHEEWALKMGEFGSFCGEQFFDIAVQSSEFRNNPQLVLLSGEPSLSGSVIDIVIANSGAVYTSVPDIEIVPADGNVTEVATAEAVLDEEGKIVDVIVTNGGSGYTQPPFVSINSSPWGTIPWDTFSFDTFNGDQLIAVIVNNIDVDSPYDDFITIDIDDNNRWITKPRDCDRDSLWPETTSNPLKLPHSGFVLFDEVDYSTYDLSTFITLTLSQPLQINDTIWVAKNRDETWGVYKVVDIDTVVTSVATNSVILNADIIFNLFDKSVFGNALIINGRLYDISRFATNTYKIDNSDEAISINDPVYVLRNLRFKNQTIKNDISDWIDTGDCFWIDEYEGVVIPPGTGGGGGGGIGITPGLLLDGVTWDEDDVSYEALITTSENIGSLSPQAADFNDSRTAFYHGWYDQDAANTWLDAGSPADSTAERLFVDVYTEGTGSWSKSTTVRQDINDIIQHEQDRIAIEPGNIVSTNFGFSSAMSSDMETMAVGAPTNHYKHWTDGSVAMSYNEGRIYVYKKSGSNYSITSVQDAPHTLYFQDGLGSYVPNTFRDSYGNIIRMSSDGTELLVAAPILMQYTWSYISGAQAFRSSVITGGVFLYSIDGSGNSILTRQFHLYETATGHPDIEAYENRFGAPLYNRQIVGNSQGGYGVEIDISPDGNLILIESRVAYKVPPEDGTLWLDPSDSKLGLHMYDGASWVEQTFDNTINGPVDDTLYYTSKPYNTNGELTVSFDNDLMRYYKNIGNKDTLIEDNIVTSIHEQEFIIPIIPSPSFSDFYGKSMKISADATRIIIGNDPQVTGGQGGAVIYRRSGSSWVAESTLTPTTTLDPLERIPQSVEISAFGDIAVECTISSITTLSNINTKAYVFERTGFTWSEIQALTPSDYNASTNDGRGFGYSVSMSFDGSVIAVGAPGDTDAAGGTTEIHQGKGAVYVFRHNGSVWVEEDKITPAIQTASDMFGFNVELSGDGNTLFISSKISISGSFPNGVVYTGKVHAYEYTGTWDLVQEILPSVTFPVNPVTNSTFVNFGQSISTTYDGSVLVCGQPYDNGENTSGLSSKYGSAVIYEKSGSTWLFEKQVYSPIELNVSVSFTFDGFGYEVEISDNGEFIYIGHPKSIIYTGSSNFNGSVMVFNKNPSTLEWEEVSRILPEFDSSSYDIFRDFGYTITSSNNGDDVFCAAKDGRLTAFPSQIVGGVHSFNVDKRDLTYSEDSIPPTSPDKGDFWIKTTSAGNGLDISLNEYNTNTSTWVSQSVENFETKDQAIDTIGSIGGTVIVVYDIQNLTSTFSFYIHNGSPEVLVTTNDVPSGMSAQTMSINGTSVSFPSNATPTDIVTLISNAGIPDLLISLSTDGLRVIFNNTAGKQLVFENVTGTMVEDLGIINSPYDNWDVLDVTVTDDEEDLLQVPDINVGSIHLYELNGSTWEKQLYLTTTQGLTGSINLLKIISNTSFMVKYQDDDIYGDTVVIYNKIDGDWLPEPSTVPITVTDGAGIISTISRRNIDISTTSGTGYVGLSSYKTSSSDTTIGALTNIARKNGEWSIQTDPFLLTLGEPTGLGLGYSVWAVSDYEVWLIRNNNEVIKAKYTPQIDEGEEAEVVFIDYKLDESVSNEDIYKTWAVIKEGDTVATRQGKELIQASNFKNMFVYDLETLNTLRMLPILDPVKGLVPGIADQNIDYKTYNDPARYTNAGEQRLIDENKIFDDTHVGLVWWDLSTTRFIFYEQGSNDFRRKNWGKVFPGSPVDVYEWVESTVVPEEYEGPGTPKNTTDYVQKFVFDSSTDTESLKYYFWVKNYTEVPNNIKHRTLSANEISRIIKDPINNDYLWFAPINQNAMVVPDLGTVLSGLTLGLQANYKQIEDDINKHAEWHILREKDTLSSVPLSYWDKLIDSISGISRKIDLEDYASDTYLVDPDDPGFGYLVVPDPYLSEYEKYGSKYRPRQTMFKDIIEARKVLVRTINNILSSYCIRDTNTDWNENISDQLIWEYVDWFEEGYDIFTIRPSQQAASITGMGVLINEKGMNGTDELKDGDIIKVVDPVRSSFFAYDRETDSPVLVSKEGCAVSLKEDTILYENDLDIKKEIREFLYAFRDDFFLESDDSILNANSLFFAMMNYAFSEQRNIDWAFKTSYIYIEQAGDELTQTKTIQRDPFDDIVDYINEVKPYHTKIRDYSVLRKLQTDIALLDVQEIFEPTITLRYDRVECGPSSPYESGCDYDGDIYDMQSFVQPSDPWDSMPWDSFGWDGEVDTVYYTASDESMPNTFAMPNPVDTIIADGTSHLYLLDTSSGAPFENIDVLNVGPFIDGEFVDNFYVYQNTSDNNWYIGFAQIYVSGTEIEIFEHAPIDGGNFLQPYQDEMVPEELVPLDPIENLVINVDTNPEPITVVYDGIPVFEPVYVIPDPDVILGTILVYYNSVLQTETVDYEIVFDGVWNNGPWNIYGWNTSVGIKFLTTTHVVTDVIEIVYELPPLSYKIHKDVFGNHEFYRSTEIYTTTLASSLLTTDTEVLVDDASVLPSATIGSPGVVWIGGEKILYHHVDYGTNTLSNLIRGADGTPIRTYDVGKYVIDGSDVQKVPLGENGLWVNSNRGLINSTTIQAEFLKAGYGRSIT